MGKKKNEPPTYQQPVAQQRQDLIPEPPFYQQLVTHQEVTPDPPPYQELVVSHDQQEAVPDSPVKKERVFFENIKEDGETIIDYIDLTVDLDEINPDANPSKEIVCLHTNSDEYILNRGELWQVAEGVLQHLIDNKETIIRPENLDYVKLIN